MLFFFWVGVRVGPEDAELFFFLVVALVVGVRDGLDDTISFLGLHAVHLSLDSFRRFTSRTISNMKQEIKR